MLLVCPWSPEDELGFLEDKLRAVSMELKAFNAARKRRVSVRAANAADVQIQETEATDDKSAAACAHGAVGFEDKAISSQVGYRR